MLAKLTSRSTFAETFQSIHIETGERYLTRVAYPLWQPHESSEQLQAFEFRPGQARQWLVTPAEILSREFMFLTTLAGMGLALPQPLEEQEADGLRFVNFRLFDGVTLAQLKESGAQIGPGLIINLLNQVNTMRTRGLFHGNLSLATILVEGDRLLISEPVMGACEFSEPERVELIRCVTNPGYYPLLDPRMDRMALGFILYELFTGRHPLRLPAELLPEKPVRRPGKRLAALIDRARERGANRFLSSLTTFINPGRVKKKITREVEEIILKTIGLARVNQGTDEEQVELVEGSWLEPWAAESAFDWTAEPEGSWRLIDSAQAIDDIARKRPRRSAPGNQQSAAATAPDFVRNS